MDPEETVQAVVVADTFDNCFHPITPKTPIALFPVLGIPLVDYVLESLALKGIDETILFCSRDSGTVREHVKTRKAQKARWSLSMGVQVVVSETCRSLGDVMRELDASALVRSHFILMGINSISNANLLPLFEKHKQIFKKDKGATMTLLYKKVSWGHRLICPEQAIFLAADKATKQVLVHQKLKPGPAYKTISLPLDVVLAHSEVDLHHNLADTNIAFCAPTVLPLYSDNFDYQTRDDFVKGVLMTEEVMTNSLYFMQLDGSSYAAAITNWNTYRTISRDLLHNWVYPLPDGVLTKKDKYIFMGDHNYRSKSATLSRSCVLGEDVMIGENAFIDENSQIDKSIIGERCKIGQNVLIEDSHLLSGVVVKDNCIIKSSYIGENCIIEEGAILDNGTIIGNENNIAAKSELKNQIISGAAAEHVASKSERTEATEWDNESVRSEEEERFVGYNKKWEDSGSDYSSASSDDLSPSPGSPVPDDTNIFLQEVIDSLARGYEEKLNCDYLILEINSSRYAYNMQLHEVNFFVVRGILSMPAISEAKNVLLVVKDIIKYFKPILENYIKTKSAIMDCLNAVEESCSKNPSLEERCGQIVHVLYEADLVDEDSLVEWYADLKSDEKDIAKQNSLVKFFDWLQQASEESDDESD